MRRDQLDHLLRAACRIADDHRVLVLGSQSILGTYPENELPPQTWASIEADFAFYDDDGLFKADSVDMHMGEDSRFHAEFGYYAQGVEVATAVLPRNWDDRTIAYRAVAAEPAVAVCLDPHDLVVSKLVAHREKDLTFAGALLAADLVNLDVLVERARLLERPFDRQLVQRWLDGWRSSR